jgi:hypothetical protein
MKTRLTYNAEQTYSSLKQVWNLSIPASALIQLGWGLDDELIIDIPMTGGGLVIHKASEQRTGEETV